MIMERFLDLLALLLATAWSCVILWTLLGARSGSVVIIVEREAWITEVALVSLSALFCFWRLVRKVYKD